MANDLNENIGSEIDELDGRSGAADQSARERDIRKSEKSAATKNAKANASVYTVMLGLSAVFLAIACLLMWRELAQWGPDYWRVNSIK